MRGVDKSQASAKYAIQENVTIRNWLKNIVSNFDWENQSHHSNSNYTKNQNKNYKKKIPQ